MASPRVHFSQRERARAQEGVPDEVQSGEHAAVRGGIGKEARQEEGGGEDVQVHRRTPERRQGECHQPLQGGHQQNRAPRTTQQVFVMCLCRDAIIRVFVNLAVVIYMVFYTYIVMNLVLTN